jgi:hypothetical protein
MVAWDGSVLTMKPLSSDRCETAVNKNLRRRPAFCSNFSESRNGGRQRTVSFCELAASPSLLLEDSFNPIERALWRRFRSKFA